MQLRTLQEGDRAGFARCLYESFNAWYWKHGWGRDYFGTAPGDCDIFYLMYRDLSPDKNVVAIDASTGRVMGGCFFSPREHHVSLGIMAVHPDFWGRGVAAALVKHITDFADANGYPAVRLASSAMNVDSFSLYTRAGFFPRQTYHDFVLPVPADGGRIQAPGAERVRDAFPADVAAMVALEMEVSGICREVDYRYAIDGGRGFLHAAVCEAPGGGIDGFMMSVKHPAFNILGPCVARNEDTALALVSRELPRFAGSAPLAIVPADKRRMVETFYGWGARNIEVHLFQVRGAFKPFNGVNMPSFLPESG